MSCVVRFECCETSTNNNITVHHCLFGDTTDAGGALAAGARVSHGRGAVAQVLSDPLRNLSRLRVADSVCGAGVHG